MYLNLEPWAEFQPPVETTRDVNDGIIRYKYKNMRDDILFEIDRTAFMHIFKGWNSREKNMSW